MSFTLWYLCRLKKHEYGGIAINIVMILALQAPSSAPTGSSLWTLFTQSSGFAFAILILLMLFSLFSWSIIIRKWMTFREIRNQNQAFIEFFRKSPRLSEVESACAHYQGSPLPGIFSAGYQELNAQIQSLKSPQSTYPVLTDRNLVGIQRALQRAATAELSVIEKSLSWLATTGSVTPFVGLLGTVVGIINAFIGLGMEKTASIQAVAPGIAEALIATAAGLFAAIPAVIAYNYFLSNMKTIAAEMDDFSMEFLNLVDRSFS
jgi:biopolymer transport protein TolQ